MSPDRRNLVEAILTNAWRTCPCGRCNCIADEPIVTARRVFAHWARQYDELASVNDRRAAVYFEQAAKLESRLSKIHRKFGSALRAEEDEMVRGWRRDAERWARFARVHRHAARLYRRLAAGEPPFGTPPGTLDTKEAHP